MRTPPEHLVTCPVLIGRTSQLETIRYLLDQVCQTKSQPFPGQILLIAGEAGLGKSRLVAETKGLAADIGGRILQGRCFDTERHLPYASIIDLLHTVQLPPELAALMPEFVSGSPLKAAPESDKHRLYYAVTQFCTDLASTQPLLLIIEDLHWCDEASLELLLYLARRSNTWPALLLFTYRSDELGPNLTHFLAQLDRQRRTTEINLAPFSREQVDLMLQAIFNRSSPTQAEFLAALYPLTEGNPFFIEEILKSMLMAGEIVVDEDNIWTEKPPRELYIPRNIQDTVHQRSQRLTLAARQTLILASVVGRHFDFSLLQYLTGSSEAILLAQLKELLAAQLIVEESADHFAFRHALTREAVYSTLLARERRQSHAEIAQLLENQMSNTAASDLAYHFYEGQIWDKALVYTLQAGEHAQSLYAPHAAIEYFSHALEAAGHLTGSLTDHLYFKRGQAQAVLNNFEAAQTDYQIALDMACAEQNHQAEWEILLALGDLWTTRDYVRTGDYFQQAQTLARSLDDQMLIAYTLNHTGNWQMNRGQPWNALDDHQEALAVFQKLNDPAGMAQTLDLLAITCYNCSDILRAQYYYQQAIPLWKQIDDRQGLMHTYSGLALLADADLEVTDISLMEQIRWGEKGVQVARDIGWRSGEALGLICWGLVMRQQGHYGPALALFQQALTLAENIGHYEWTVDACCAIGALYLDILALDEARQILEPALALAHQLNSVIWITYISIVLAVVAVLQHNFDKARTILSELYPADVPPNMLHQRFIQAVWVELALAEDQPELALTIAEQLIASTSNLPDSNSSAQVGNSAEQSASAEIEAAYIIPHLWFLRGRALIGLNQLSAAEADLQAALAAAKNQGRQRLIWRIYSALGQLYLNQRNSQAAEQAIEAARTAIEQIVTTLSDESLPKAGLLAENFSRQALALLPDAPMLSPQELAKQQFGGLTNREREVAVLVAKGNSNRDIAETLVLSERTAERHIANIMSKLGFNSRAQIAAWTVDKGLVSNL